MRRVKKPPDAYISRRTEVEKQTKFGVQGMTLNNSGSLSPILSIQAPILHGFGDVVDSYVFRA